MQDGNRASMSFPSKVVLTRLQNYIVNLK